MLRFLLPSLGLVVLSSCTMILSTNIPGKQQQTLPAEWLGKYEVITASLLPDKRDSANNEKEFAIIESTRITWKSVDGDKIFSLKDSLRYSAIDGGSRYLSLLMPQGLFAVFKVIIKADTLELHSLSADDDIKKSELNRYFDNVERLKSGDEEYYKVTIADKKLDGYFKTAIPSKEITKLVKVR